MPLFSLGPGLAPRSPSFSRSGVVENASLRPAKGNP
jgi:hypothetical protein